MKCTPDHIICSTIYSVYVASFSSHELYIKAFIDVIKTILVLIYFVQSTVYCIKLETNYVSDKTGLYIDLDKPVLAMLTLCMFLYLFFFRYFILLQFTCQRGSKSISSCCSH